ncbi:hypothetical protein C8034_v003738 [Colletotrichum sidae]|uniref:Uncharacterized protein n=1 Tax=Colletotrichum sidae TaxID=1347389 RepID=A0A4R8T9K2_9PEZI|nr:hypothetical protein C8034_v003738 [Colletotrichum sidae]
MKSIISYVLLALFFGIGLAQRSNIQCQCRAHLANSAVRTGGLELCARRGGNLTPDREMCTHLRHNKRFTDEDCKTLGDTFFASCGSARSELKRGIYKREVVPLSTRPSSRYERVVRRLSKF